MAGQISSSQAFRNRSRKWATAACLGAVLLGVGAMAGHHYLFGALSLLASVVLFKGSTFSRKHRASSMRANGAPAALPRRRPLRKAA
jgi:hypothetical protein